MLRIAAIAILTAVTLFPHQEVRKPSPKVTSADEMEVMVLFSGLMVFNENPYTGSYEVGILGRGQSDGHEFCVQRLGATRVCRKPAGAEGSTPPGHDEEWLPEGAKWVLSVPNKPNDEPVGLSHREKRRPDVEGEQFDFSWIIDLDGPQFHKKLDLKPGLLAPIIQLPKVKLFTKYKSPDFVRWQGERPKDKQPEPFGFVAETIGFRVFLKKDQELTLTDVTTKKTVASIPYVAPSPVGGNYEVLYISNTRYPQHEGSDFKMYYNLFSNVKEDQQYDFAENEKPCKPPVEEPCKPLNPAPKKPKPTPDKKIKKVTCCGLVCTEIRLVNWGKPLH